MCLAQQENTKTEPEEKKNLFFYFHKFNFLLLFPAFVRRMRRECAEDTRTFTSSSSFFFDLVLSVIFGKNENASKEDKKHRIRFRANLLLCLAFNIYFFVYYLWNWLETTTTKLETSVDSLLSVFVFALKFSYSRVKRGEKKKWKKREERIFHWSERSLEWVRVRRNWIGTREMSCSLLGNNSSYFFFVKAIFTREKWDDDEEEL